MKKYLTTGVISNTFGSFPVMSQSDDMTSWDDAVSIFQTNETPTGIASNGNIAAVSNALGYVTTTSNLVSFSNTIVSNGFGITGINASNSTWIIIGQRIYINAYGPYSAGSEVSQVFKASAPNSLWAMVWSHPDNDSRLYQVKFLEDAPITSSITSDVWVAVGDQNSEGLLIYSLDNGNTWTTSVVPTGIGRILSLELVKGIGDDPYWLWGGDGRLFRSNTLDSTIWTQMNVSRSSRITQIVSTGTGIIGIAGTDKIYSTQDGINFRTWDYPGYTFDKLFLMDNNEPEHKWIAAGRSILTQYTQWVSNDLAIWTPSDNGITSIGYSIGEIDTPP